MLAQSFQSAAELGITEPQKEALMKTLVLLETGRLVHVPCDTPMETLESYSIDDKSFDGFFNMDNSFARADCGTVCCIRGTAMLVGRVQFSLANMPSGLSSLFYSWRGRDPSTTQAATALRSYLTTGDAKWHEAVS